MTKRNQKRTGPKSGFKRKNVPGYYLSVDKLGRHTWKASKKVEKILRRDDFFNSDVPAGMIVSLNRSTNVVVLGIDNNRAVFYNPVSDIIGYTAFGRAKTIIVRGQVTNEFFEKEKGLLEKKILGTNLKVSDFIRKSHHFGELEKGQKTELEKYAEHARIGDCLKNKLGHKLKILAVTKSHVVFENQDTGQHGAVNINKDKSEYEVGGDSKLDINLKSLQSAFRDKRYLSIRTSTGSRIIKAKQANLRKIRDKNGEEIEFSPVMISSIKIEKSQFVKQLENAPEVNNDRRNEIINKGRRLSELIKKYEEAGKTIFDAVSEFFKDSG